MASAHVASWSDALASGMSAQRWSKQALLASHGSHPSLQLILIRQALSTDPSTRKWLQEHDHNGMTTESLIKDFVAKFGTNEDQAPVVESTAPWTTLPSEILFAILSYLSPADLRACTLVCRMFRTASNDDALWRNLHVRAWGELSSPPKDSSWRKQFAKSCFPADTKTSGLRVRLDRDIVYSGQATVLTGEVYLRLTKKILTTGLLVTLFGFETMEMTGMRQSAAHTGYHSQLVQHTYFSEEKRLLAPAQDDTDYLRQDLPQFVLEPGLYSVPFSFIVPAYGIHGRTLQRTFMSVDPITQVAYGVRAKLTVKYTSAMDSMLSVFSSPELLATAGFFVDRFYDPTPLRVPDPVETTAKMDFMLGGPIIAKLVLETKAAVAGGAPFRVSLQVENRSRYDVVGATIGLSAACRRRPYEGEVAPKVYFVANELVSASKPVTQMDCPFIQAPAGISTAWNWQYPLPPSVGPSIPHAHLFEYFHRLTLNIKVSFTLSSLSLTVPVIVLGPNFSM